MNVMVVADSHYYKDYDGNIYVDSVFNYSFYKRYLDVFDKVYVVARVSFVKNSPSEKKIASGDGVEFLELPEYRGPWQYAKKYLKIKKLAKKYSDLVDCAIFRIPGATANIMCKTYYRTKKPFAVEVVVDPWEYFAKGTVKSIARPLVRYSWTNFVRRICKVANGVSYVTENYLQRLYPCKAIINKESKNYFTSYYSSVELKSGSFKSPKKYDEKDEFIISHVANSFTGYGKGHITLMKALKVVRDKGYKVRVVFIGDGPLKEEFIEFSKNIGVENYVEFTGKLSDGDEVRRVIVNSDLFVFPTMAEGLPRVLLEAMSVGLPCISSPVCGIPEILSEDFLCNYNDYNGFADKIMNLISNTDLMEKASIKNLEIASRYSDIILSERRREFYTKLKNLAESYGDSNTNKF